MGFGEGTFFKKFLPQETLFSKPQTDGDGVVDGGHGGGIEVAHFFAETAFVDGTYLFEQDDGIFLETDLIGVYVDVGGQLCLPHPAGDSGRDHGRAVLVADVVLHDEDRPDAALFASDDGTEVRIINIAPFDGHFASFLSLFVTSLFTSIVWSAAPVFKHASVFFSASLCPQDMRRLSGWCVRNVRFFSPYQCETVGNLLPNGDGWYIICNSIMTQQVYGVFHENIP